MRGNTSTNTYVEYTIAYGDGDIDDEQWASANDAQKQIDDIRFAVAHGDWEAEDYPEPMQVVKRTVTQTVTATAWEDVP